MGEEKDSLPDKDLTAQIIQAAIAPIHFSIVRSYMKAMHVNSGLLFNFASMPLTVKRVVREIPSRLPEFQINEPPCSQP